jgi:hypothetical protein
MNSEKQKELTLELDGKPVKIVLARATTRMGIQRSLMIYKALDEHKKNPDEDEVVYSFNFRTLPDLISGTVSIEGVDMTAEAIMELPEEFTDAWLQAIYEMNPQWNPAKFFAEEEDVKKKK